jgi:hypothetical protein
MTSDKLLGPEIEIELPKSFQPLQSFVTSALGDENDYNFFHQLCENVIPLLQIMPLLGPLRAKWQEERNQYMAKLSSGLCSLLFKNGKGDVLEGMIRINEKIEYVFENDSYILKSIPFISHYCFGPSVLIARSLRAEWNWKEQAPFWLIWTHLCNAAWAWHAHAPMNFFENEKLKYATPILRKRTMRLIELQNCFREMQDRLPILLGLQ